MFTVSEQGNTLLLTEITRANRKPRVFRLDKNRYQNAKTGQILVYENHAEDRTGNTKSLYRTFAELRGIINTNITKPQNVLWVTFTYAENMTDTKRLKTDWNNFWKRFLYYCNKEDIAAPEYITTAEPQARGAWHLHALLIFPSRRPFIANEKMAEIWQQGFTKTKALKNSDNVAGYLCAYLSDLPLIELDPDTKTPKAIEKGARLAFYPVGFHLYRCSRGIKKPTKREIDEHEAARIRSTYELSGQSKQSITESATNYHTDIIKQWFLIE